jgi:hypothetical protein
VNDENDPEVVADMSDIDNPYDGCGYALISHHAVKSRAMNNEAKTRQQKHKENLMHRKTRFARRR